MLPEKEILFKALAQVAGRKQMDRIQILDSTINLLKQEVARLKNPKK